MFHMMCSEGPALYLEEDLNKGQTNKSDTYGNLRLNGDWAVKGSNSM
jgi:hypothetical protein